MAEPETEFVIISDDDGHNYVCPADKSSEAYAAIEAIESYWRNALHDDGDPPGLPAYLVEVGGSIGRVRFKQFRIGS